MLFNILNPLWLGSNKPGEPSLIDVQRSLPLLGRSCRSCGQVGEFISRCLEKTLTFTVNRKAYSDLLVKYKSKVIETEAENEKVIDY
jgi:hypothetical protein